MKRTLLPLNGLRVFDAAARHLSFTRAADELAVTPAAVGQHIRALEEVLGVVLFRRTSKGLELTHEAEMGLAGLKQGFLHFEDAVSAMRSGQSSKSLAIAAPRDFTQSWLLPRLRRYAEQHPDLQFHLHVAESEVDFTQMNLDCAIVYAQDKGEYQGVQLAAGAMSCIGQGAPIVWQADQPQEGARLKVADAGLALAAAQIGFGQAHVPALLVESEAGGSEKDTRAYWLIAPLPQWRQAKVKALCAALAGEA
jgi:LysR family transcriptional regulator, glycine cleavage system transcriptional activator